MSDSVWPHRRQPTRLPRPWDSPGKNTGVGCHFLLECMKVKSESEVAQSCPTLSDPMDCSPPGSSIHGIFQARVLEWGAIAFSDDKPTQHIKKQRHYFANKGLSSQTTVFPVVMYGCKSWTIKKAERQRIDAFELWCWRRPLRVPWTAGRSNQSILKEISPEYSLEGLMLKLKLWPPDAKNWLIGKDPDAGKDWRREEKGTTENEIVGWHHRLDGHEFEQASGVGDGQGSLENCSPWGHKDLDTTGQLSWTELSPHTAQGRSCMLQSNSPLPSHIANGHSVATTSSVAWIMLLIWIWFIL